MSHCEPPLPREVVAKGGKDEKSVFDDIFGNGYDEESDHEETQVSCLMFYLILLFLFVFDSYILPPLCI